MKTVNQNLILNKTAVFFLTIIVSLVFSFTKAQKKGANISVGVLLGTQITSGLQWENMEKFLTAYNERLSDKLSSKLLTPKPSAGFTWGLEGNVYFFHIQYRHTNFDAVSESKMYNGESRILEQDMSLNNVSMDLVVPLGELLGLGYSMGFYYQNGDLHSRYRYADGTISYADDKNLNGIFRASFAFGMSIGPRMDVGYKWVKLSFKPEYYGFLNKFLSSSEPLPYTNMMYQLGTSTFFNDGEIKQFMDEEVKGGYSGWVYTIVLKLSPLYFSAN